MTTHEQPWAQLLLYEYNLMRGEQQFYEFADWGEDDWTFRFASHPDNMNILVQFDSDGITPPP